LFSWPKDSGSEGWRSPRKWWLGRWEGDSGTGFLPFLPAHRVEKGIPLREFVSFPAARFGWLVLLDLRLRSGDPQFRRVDRALFCTQPYRRSMESQVALIRGNLFSAADLNDRSSQENLSSLLMLLHHTRKFKMNWCLRTEMTSNLVEKCLKLISPRN
jgi:hypothetical protein